MLNTEFLCGSPTGRKLYEKTKSLPIIDYHCHLSPEEILNDEEFENIGVAWLGGDHYKWRLMRQAGIDEKYITGSASWEEKFCRYIECVSLAAGNPLYSWSKMELELYFGVTLPLKAENAKAIWEQANKKIHEDKLSPRKMIRDCGVEWLATTDDPASDLRFHKLLLEDESFKTRVTPSFRPDSLLLIRNSGYAETVKNFAASAEMEIQSLCDLKKALAKRLDYFKENGCVFTDVGIEAFPDRIASDEDADSTFRAALKGETVSDEDYLAYLGNLYIYLGKEYAKRNMVMQLHLGVRRNVNSKMHASLGVDCGGDCLGDPIPTGDIIRILDALNSENALPRTILYTLNPAMAASLTAIAGSFPNILMGAAWWFCDHKRGIQNQLDTIAEEGYLATNLGMLTDSRSFLSYARHDFFRRILCEKIGEWVDKGEFDPDSAEILAERICYSNIKKLIEA